MYMETKTPLETKNLKRNKKVFGNEEMKYIFIDNKNLIE